MFVLGGCQLLLDFSVDRNQAETGGATSTSSGTAANGGAGGSRSSNSYGGATAETSTSGGMSGNYSTLTGGTSAIVASSLAGGTGGNNSTATDASGGRSATGGTAAGGISTSTTSVSFRGGPCVVSPNSSTVEVFARNTSRVYRIPLGGALVPKWTALGDLDGAPIDNRSDLDCSANSTTIHIVTMGVSPLGALLRAIGSGTSYNPFTRELANAGLTSSTWDPSPTVATTGNTAPNDARLALFSQGGLLAGALSGATFTGFGSITTATTNFVSSADIAVATGTGDTTLVAAFDETNALSVHRYYQSSSQPTWVTPLIQLPAPTGTLYMYSPTVCTSDFSGTRMYHLAAVAGGKLWYSSKNVSLGQDFSAWLSVSSDIASAPDCVVTNDNVVHIVALNSNGGVTHHFGSGVSWTSTDLGTY